MTCVEKCKKRKHSLEDAMTAAYMVRIRIRVNISIIMVRVR